MIGTRLSNAKAHKLINMMAGNHAELNDETLNNTAGDRQAQFLVVKMADTPKEFEEEALAATLVDRLDQKLPEVKSETLS